MGNFFSKTTEKEPSWSGGNLKLDSQKVTEFLGRIEDWQRWKSRTTCAFDGSGYEQILTDPVYAVMNPRANKIVYAQLSVATVSGTAHHLVKQFDTSKNGNMAWDALVEWYDGDAIKNETADALRDKLSHLKLSTSMSAASYINNFLTWYRDLCKIPGEGISDSHAISMFLSNITDPAYSTFVQIQKAQVTDLKTAVVAIRKHERDIVSTRSQRRRFGTQNVRRRRYEEDYDHYGPSQHDNYDHYDNDNYRQMQPFKRRRVSEDRRKKFQVTPDRGGRLNFESHIWNNEMNQEEKDFICDYNLKRKHGEKTTLYGCPLSIDVLRTDHQRTRRVNDDRYHYNRQSEETKSESVVRRVDPQHSGEDDRDDTVTERKEGKRNSDLRRKISFNLDRENKSGD